jgi:tetratricopeptide (TPR) repeat protein
MGHPQRDSSLSDVASSLRALYERTGDMLALGEAIMLHREALSLRPAGHRSRGVSLNNLAGALGRLLGHTGYMTGSTEAVELYREALSLTPAGHPNRVTSLNNLASALLKSFEHVNDRAALTEAIRLHREALSLRPVGHANRDDSLDNLASSLLSLAKHAGDTSSLRQAIQFYRKVVSLRPSGHPNRANALHSLSSALLLEFERTKDEKALTEALELSQQCLKIRPQDHPRSHSSHYTIAAIQLQESSLFDGDGALAHIHLALTDHRASSRTRLGEAIPLLALVEAATARNPKLLHSRLALDVYLAAVHLLPSVNNLGHDSSVRLRELSDVERLCHVAALRAISLNDLAITAELLDVGNTMLWQQALQPRTTALDQLPSEDKAKFAGLMRMLEREDDGFGNIRDATDMERRIDRRRTLSLEAQQLIGDIRTRPGFEHFMKTPKYAELAQASRNGPVVLLVDSGLAPFALIVKSPDDMVPTKLDLPALGKQNLHQLRLHASMLGIREKPSDQDINSVQDHRPELSTPQAQDACDDLLARVWSAIVEPVVKVLGLNVSTCELYFRDIL